MANIPVLVTAIRKAGPDSFPDAKLSALGALMAIRAASPQAARSVDHEALPAIPAQDDYLVRRWAEANWPAAAAAWGPEYQVRTGRSLEDYRNIARTYVVGQLPPAIRRSRWMWPSSAWWNCSSSARRLR